MEAIFDLMLWVLKTSRWFVSKLLEGKLPWVMIIVVVSLAGICAILGANYELTVSDKPTLAGEAQFIAIVGAIAGGSLGALIGFGIAYVYYRAKK